MELARLKARKDAIRVSGNQTIAVTGSMSFGAVVDSLINSGIAAEAVESLASKLVSLAAGASGPFVAVLGGTALLWWFSPIEAGESEEQATAWMKKEGNSVDSETGREYKKKKQVKGKQKDDIPERFRGEKPYKGESGKEAAKRVLEKYGEYDPKETGPGSDFSKLKKYFDTHFE